MQARQGPQQGLGLALERGRTRAQAWALAPAWAPASTAPISQLLSEALPPALFANHHRKQLLLVPRMQKQKVDCTGRLQGHRVSCRAASIIRCQMDVIHINVSRAQNSPEWERAMAVAMAKGMVTATAGVMVRVKAEPAQLLRRAGTAHWFGCRHGLCE